MIWTMMDIIMCIIETAIIADFLIEYFGWKDRNYTIGKALLLFAIALIPDIFVTFYNVPQAPGQATLIICLVMYAIICLKKGSLEKILVICMIILVMDVVSLLVISVTSFMAGMQPIEFIASNSKAYVLMLCISKIVFFIITRMILLQRNRQNYKLKLSEWCIIILMFVVALGVLLLQEYMVFENHSSEIAFLLMMILLMMVTIAMYYIVLSMSRKNNQEMELQLLKLQMSTQEREVKEVEKRYEEIQKIRHDMKNYVSNTLALLEEGNLQAGIAYMKDFRHMKLEKHKTFITTDSPVVNAVINSKFSYAYQRDIAVDALLLCKEFSVNELNLSILLSNLLDNAIEACERNTIASKIELRMEKEDAYLRISVKNTIETSVLDKNKDMETSKQDKKHHGYGMKSIKEIVNKYEGSMELEEKEGEFINDILLKMEKITG